MIGKMPPMKRVQIPGLTPAITPIAYGTAGLSARLSPEDAWQVLDAYVEAGGNFIDTAHCYASWVEGGHGKSELLIGHWLRRTKPEDVVLATKGGHVSFGDYYKRPEHFMAPEVIKQDFAESLQRLEVDRVDLYYLHRDDPRMPVSEIVDMVHELVESGQTGAVGVSNWSAARVREALAYADQSGKTRFSVVQNQWSYVHPNWASREPGAQIFVSEDERAAFEGMNLPIAAYTPVAGGYLGTANGQEGSFDSDASKRRLKRLQTVARKLGTDPTTLGIAWLLHQTPLTIPIIGTKQIDRLHQSLQALSLEIPDGEFRELNEA